MHKHWPVAAAMLLIAITMLGCGANQADKGDGQLVVSSAEFRNYSGMHLQIQNNSDAAIADIDLVVEFKDPARQVPYETVRMRSIHIPDGIEPGEQKSLSLRLDVDPAAITVPHDHPETYAVFVAVSDSGHSGSKSQMTQANWKRQTRPDNADGRDPHLDMLMQADPAAANEKARLFDGIDPELKGLLDSPKD